MKRRALIAMVLLLATAEARPTAFAGEVVDRIVARIEGDIITLSEVRELGAFQQLAGRAPAQDEEALLGQLIEQWMVANDAAAARFPQPAAADVEREIAALEHHSGTREAFAARLAELGLTARALRRLVERELYLEQYLDYKFRPIVQIEAEAVERYYHEKLIPELQARKETPPPLDKVSEQIRELLVQQEMSRRNAEWLQQTRAQVRVELLGSAEGRSTVKAPVKKPAPKGFR
jgi:peptidyl-prolyl cis-trans isomerase SurA